MFLAREVSPKYVVGKKKYGRRSRPENSENEGQFTDDTDDIHHTPQSCSTDDSDVEQSAPKKRRARASKRRDLKNDKKALSKFIQMQRIKM